MRILHIITGLGKGGAEMALCRLTEASRGKVEHVVVSMEDEGLYGPRLREMGIAVHELGFRPGRITVKGVHRLWRLIKDSKPDAVQTWMYHADLAGGLIARLAGIRSVVWGIRNSNLSPKTSTWSTRLAAHLCARLSGWLPATIVSCSQGAATIHQQLGYCPSKFAIILNDYDVLRFSPQRQVALALRADWDIPLQLPLLGMVARWHPDKDHANLLTALAILRKRGRDFCCALVGPGLERGNESLWRLISEKDLMNNVILLGSRDDIPDVMNAIDLFVLSSCPEAFPNVVAEAMACGTPCVVTNVGDAVLIVGKTGWVAPPEGPIALAQGIEAGLLAVQSSQREEISKACRERIADCFGIERMTAAYTRIWSACSVVK
jgi:glycosyltransferase involved in cell wall biosynthesis